MIAPSSKFRWAVSFAAWFTTCQLLTGCSWLIEVDRDQCARASDCAALGLDGTCEQGVCVAASEPDDDDSALCDGGAQCAAGDAGAGSPAPGGGPDSCLGSKTCSTGKVCFKDKCVVERDVERFICNRGVPPRSETIHFEMPVREFVSAKPPKGMVVDACRVNDVSCTDPVLTFEDKAGSGDIAVDLPYDFSGYLEVRSDDALTALWYFTQPLIEPQVAKPLAVVAPSSLNLLASVTGLTVDASKGVVILEAFDCDELAIGGIHFDESKKAATPFFIVDGLPNTESTVTARDDAANQAVGGFLNAAPGFTIFSARIGVDGTLLGEFNGNVRANTVTYLDIHP